MSLSNKIIKMEPEDLDMIYIKFVKEFIKDDVLKEIELEFFQSNPLRCSELLNKIKAKAGEGLLK